MKPIYLELSRLYFSLGKGITSQLKVLLIFQKGDMLGTYFTRDVGIPGVPAILHCTNATCTIHDKQSEWFGVEEHLKITQFQAPAVSRDTFH